MNLPCTLSRSFSDDTIAIHYLLGVNNNLFLHITTLLRTTARRSHLVAQGAVTSECESRVHFPCHARVTSWHRVQLAVSSRSALTNALLGTAAAKHGEPTPRLLARPRRCKRQGRTLPTTVNPSRTPRPPHRRPRRWQTTNCKVALSSLRLSNRRLTNRRK